MPLIGGVRPPIAALPCLLLAVAGFTAIGLSTVHAQDVPQAVPDAERRIATDAADLAAASMNADARAVRRSAELAAPAADTTPAEALRSLLLAGPTTVGGVLADPDTGRALAASGEAVPLTAAELVAAARSDTDAVAPRLATSASGQPRLLLFAQVTAPGRNGNGNQGQARDQAGNRRSKDRELLLVVSEDLALPVVHGDGRTGQLLDQHGKVLAAAAGAPAPDAATPDLSVAVATAAAHTADASGSVVRPGRDGLRRVAGWASVTGPEDGDGISELGLTVLTFQDVAPAHTRADHVWFAGATALALAVTALLLATVLRRAVQLPLLRLHLSAARLARGVRDRPALSRELVRRVPRAAFGELARTSRALESIRRQLLGETGPGVVRRRVRRRPGVRILVLGCGVVVAAWGVPMLFLLNRVPAAAIPAAVVADQQARTETAADRLQLSLGRNVTDLVTVASALSGQPRERAANLLRGELADHPAYRSLYVLDRTGAVSLRVGKEPLRTPGQAPAGNGITQINSSGRIPAIAVYSQIPAAGAAKDADPAVLFAEIDVNAVGSLLTRPGLGSVWLADERDLVLAAGAGFEAFQPLPSSGLVHLAKRTEGQAGSPAAAVLHGGTDPSTSLSVAAVAPLAQTGPGAALGWRVVSAEPAEALELMAYQVRDRTMLAGLLALTVGVACLCWLHIVVVRPLRALTKCAERLAGGDRRTVLYPLNHDECGSVIRSLELLRQVLLESERRAGPDPIPVPAQSCRRVSAPQP